MRTRGCGHHGYSRVLRARPMKIVRRVLAFGVNADSRRPPRFVLLGFDRRAGKGDRHAALAEASTLIRDSSSDPRPALIASDLAASSRASSGARVDGRHAEARRSFNPVAGKPRQQRPNRDHDHSRAKAAIFRGNPCCRGSARTRARVDRDFSRGAKEPPGVRTGILN